MAEPALHPAPSDTQLDAWLTSLRANYGDAELALVRQALTFSAQTQTGGSSRLDDARAIAQILCDLHMDHETIAAALLHSAGATDDATHVEKIFGPAISRLTDGVNRMAIAQDLPDQPDERKKQQAHAESLRKMLLAIAEDLRVVLIKLAQRLHGMRRINDLPAEQRARVARETLDIYAPLANRLGIWQIKGELEDLAFQTLQPDTYRELRGLLDERRDAREANFKRIVQTLENELTKLGIAAEISSRRKHLYSIWRKMQRKGVDFHHVFDIRAMRVLVKDLAACYATLGVVHSLWPPIAGEFDDYIVRPKSNFYQSLHTAVHGPDGQTLEVQIRTPEMHQHAELGVAAHWTYKEGGKRQDARFEEKIAWLRRLLEVKAEDTEAGDFIDRFKAEVFQDRVYVLTPRGAIIDLPQGATPLDFAYHIHTDIGHRCRGAKVNGSIVPLTYELKTGEQVEVLTAKQGTPSRDWLNPHLGYLKSAHARAKARGWFKLQDHDKNIAAGRTTLDRELRRLGISDVNLARLAQRLHFNEADDFLAAIGRGDVHHAQIVHAVQEQAPLPESALPPPQSPRATTPSVVPDAISISGVGNLLTQTARCCKPLPSDAVIGYITRGRGVTIHRRNCPNLMRLAQQHRDRLIEVGWSAKAAHTYPVDVHIEAYDRQGLLRDITALLAQEKVNVHAINTTTDKRTHRAHMQLTVEIADMSQLSRVLARIGELPNIIEARRQA